MVRCFAISLQHDARILTAGLNNRQLPSALVLFLSNLPKSVMAFRFEKLESVIQQIEIIYDDKFASDQADEADGVAADELVGIRSPYKMNWPGNLTRSCCCSPILSRSSFSRPTDCVKAPRSLCIASSSQSRVSIASTPKCSSLLGFSMRFTAMLTV